MMVELLEGSEPPPRDWPRRARRAAWLAWQWLLGASFVAFWLLVAAHCWLGARPFGRLVWEPWGRESGIGSGESEAAPARFPTADSRLPPDRR